MYWYARCLLHIGHPGGEESCDRCENKEAHGDRVADGWLDGWMVSQAILELHANHLAIQPSKKTTLEYPRNHLVSPPMRSTLFLSDQDN